ncbi:MAG: hypothetical protein IJ920_02645 [Paludibacteraceae bacterium]|nr:hypothetical protein [Paludibacteraceae bacterium]
MRKLLLLAVSLLLTVTTIYAERVSQADAALVAKNFMSAPAVQTGVKKAVPTEWCSKKLLRQKKTSTMCMKMPTEKDG